MESIKNSTFSKFEGSEISGLSTIKGGAPTGGGSNCEVVEEDGCFWEERTTWQSDNTDGWKFCFTLSYHQM